MGLFKHFHVLYIYLANLFSSPYFILFFNYAKISQNFGYDNVGEMTTKEFDMLALDGFNFPIWVMDLKVSLSTNGLYRCIDETTDGTVTPSNMSKFSALKVIRNHIHPYLKMEYMLEEDPRALWTSLKNRYEQHKAIILPEVSHEWNHSRLQDFKTIDEYNYVVHKI